MHSRENDTSEQKITADQFAILCKKNQELEESLKKEIASAKEKEQAFKQKEEEVRQLTSAVLYRTAKEEEYKNNLDKTQKELSTTQDENKDQKTQLAEMSKLKFQLAKQTDETKAEIKKLNSKIGLYKDEDKQLHKTISSLSKKNLEIQKELDIAKKQASTKSYKKMGLGTGIFVTGALLIAMGIGGAFIPWIVVLAASVLGVVAAVGSLGYGIYKLIRHCCCPSKQLPDLSTHAISEGPEKRDLPPSLHPALRSLVSPAAKGHIRSPEAKGLRPSTSDSIQLEPIEELEDETSEFSYKKR